MVFSGQGTGKTGLSIGAGYTVLSIKFQESRLSGIELECALCSKWLGVADMTWAGGLKLLDQGSIEAIQY